MNMTHMMDNDTVHSTHTMEMYFHADNNEYILFEDLETTSNGAMVGACVVVFVVAVLYEGLKSFREVLLQRNIQPLNDLGLKDSSAYTPYRMLSSTHLLQSLLHVVQTFISYCLMLIFMTFNVWLCVAVVLGAGLGYFLFGWRRASIVDQNEHCH